VDSSKGSRGIKAGALRIVGGRYRSRRLRVAPRPGLRPTPDRVRETLFNWLGQDLAGLACLDLYAGSGALGFEAASRGAARVVLVEKDRLVRDELERSRATLGATQVQIVGGDADRFLEGDAGQFDVVFLDPPFRQNALPAILDRLPRLLRPGARVYVESEAAMDASPPWAELRRARAGQVSYQLLRWDGHDQGGVPGNV
jgi:16S rRNA (guanine(966)-N(2))-methyltransferase RsmD